MGFSLFYIFQRFFYRLADFFHNWYVHGSKYLIHRFVSVLENVDRTVAIKVTLRYFFQPLYKDYTIVGRILGIVFRSGRLFVGGIIYACFILLFVGIFIIWLIFPPAILFYAAYKEINAF